MKTKKTSVTTLYKSFITVFIFTILAVCASLVFYFFIDKKISILDTFNSAYTVTKAFHTVVTFFPIIIIASLIFCLSKLFSKMDEQNIVERSQAMKQYLKALLTVLIILAILSFLVLNIIKPLLSQRLRNFLHETKNYNESIFQAEQILKANEHENYLLAQNHIKNALAISPRAAKAINLFESLKVRLESEGKQIEPKQEPHIDEDNFLALSQKAYDEQDYFSAHYFALAARAQSPLGSNEYQVANKLVTESWLGIESGDKVTEEKERAYYKKKLNAYNTLQGGAYLKAYRLLKDIVAELETEEAKTKDAQIESLLALTRQKLESQVLFYSNLEAAPPITNFTPISLAINSGKNLHSKLEAKSSGYAVNKKTNAKELFLKDVTFTRYATNGNQIFALKTPYARLIEHPNTTKNETILQLTLASEDDRPDLYPDVIAGNVTEPELLYQSLPTLFDDITLAIEAVRPLSEMDFTKLIKMYQISEKFNLSSKDVLTELNLRICFVFILILAGLVIAKLSWVFRLEYGKSNLRYLIFVPAIFLFSNIFGEIIRMVIGIISGFAVSALSKLCLILMPLCLIILIIISAVRFYRLAKV